MARKELQRMIVIGLKPLTVSRAWQGRRFKTPEYRQWEQDALWMLKGSPVHSGAVSVRIRLYMANASRSDFDNPLKVLCDVLTKAGVIEDDCKIWEAHITKIQSKDEHIEVEILPYLEATQTGV